MCGICCVFSSENTTDNLLKLYDNFKPNLLRRGPDSSAEITQTCCDYNFLFSASVLWLQGNKLQAQPIETSKSVLVYNGDIFDGINSELLKTKGDTICLLEKLEEYDEAAVTLNHFDGPYAYVLLKKNTKQLYFGRDIYGRRSLLICKSKGTLTLTSVADKTLECKCLELPAIGNFCLNLENGSLYLIPWKRKNDNVTTKLQQLEQFLECKIDVVDTFAHMVNLQSFTEPKDADLKLLFHIKEMQPESALQYLLFNEPWRERVETLKRLLEEAVERRISTQPKACQDCILKEGTECDHTLTGVLFSGGVDCAILALLADKFTSSSRPIDLLNVSFDEKNSYDSPDRITGRQTFEELKRLCPCRKWNFVEINVGKEELDSQRNGRIVNLIFPLCTIMDDSLGCALWFAARGSDVKYTSPCRVVLVGMGADELFGGYTKHKAALKNHSWRGLHNSLENDWENISYRNLGRDDRVVSDHGRQLRTPYLDERVVRFARRLNCWEKTFPMYLPQGLGEKILLRSLAYDLGLKTAAVLKKRALQFGSRIANSKENANDISPRL